MFSRSSALRSAAKSRVGRIAAAGAVAAIAITLSASPASADSYKYVTLPSGRGYFEFADNGDHFTVCDTKADGHGVSAILISRDIHGTQRVVLSLDDGGDSGCDSKVYDINALYDYQMSVYWNGDNVYHSGPWFTE
ncbi:hypothetical protein BX281_4565 [Streptomyces sp. Ag82_O1-15]|uniref:hypothetical protein n=1 Tax=Streptomyces sp. Ag82_O1-15 TaxID=1938855 RepID=UPI000BD301DF|nr:hypothetical protein [Streptomyces sp. Ag82_O1-15]PBC96567.1 hypothetical protein BX281_4565 [Streptomyces sp. Ag82_O1-15]